MISAGALPKLIGVLLLVTAFVVVLEWNAIRALPDEVSHGLRGRGSDPMGMASGFSSLAGLMKSGRRSPPSSADLSFPMPPEVRHWKCKSATFGLSDLPTVTIIIPYLQERWEHIRPTVASILANTPMELVDEILFIDDANPEAFEFHENITNMHPKIRVHRNEVRQGLIKAKATGALLTSSPVIMFMEPHCIVNRQWLEPLLARMAEFEDHSNVVMPMLDIIPEDNFAAYKAANHHIGGFDWSLTFNWMVTIEERNASYSLPEPYPTPALSGGIFAIWKDYWERMGTYDTEMTEWGGEHIEMSLRLWRCGGHIDIVPCSRIGHLFRSRNPYPVHGDKILRNLKRAALVWLDDYVEKFYKETGYQNARKADAGNLTERFLLKERLQCKSMDWYMDNIYPELRGKQPRRR